jgi:hypothetical protein
MRARRDYEPTREAAMTASAQELAAGVKAACDTPVPRPIQNVSGLSQGLAGHFGGGSQTEAY